ncbi:MAG: MOSC domain-containing protein [Anaerolineae bacterium]|nr:MOSC domain-containing protein [Anaerolineae bacterium]
MMSSTLIDIAVKSQSDAPMQRVDMVSAEVSTGLHGDYHTRGNRQVTVVFKDAWETACAELGVALSWTTRRANLFVDGVVLSDCAGTRMEIGDVVLEVTGETKPCHVMDEAYMGLRDALTPEWRAGVTCKIVRNGTMRVGDAVKVL